MTGAPGDVAVTAWAPGRVNLMGDHTDHADGPVLPAAVALGTTVTGRRGGPELVLRSGWAGEEAAVPLDRLDAVADGIEPAPAWVRLAAAVAAAVAPASGFTGEVGTDLPVGAGLSSSASFELALALALGADGDPVALARLGQAAERRALGVPCGIMDQLAAAAGVAGHALRIDCATAEVVPVPVPDGLEVLVVHSGVARDLASSPYAVRVAEVAAAGAALGGWAAADEATVAALGRREPRLARRARHVLREGRRVDEVARALAADDRPTLARAFADSHASLRDDLEVTVPALDELVDALVATPGVVGARPTGAGFGGCAVALVEAGAAPPPGWDRWWRLAAGPGPRVATSA